MFEGAIYTPSAMKSLRNHIEPKGSLKNNQIIADMRIIGRIPGLGIISKH
jgi:hypothetical protein